MFKFGDKVIIRDGSLLDGVLGVVYRIDDDRISVLLEQEVIWHVSPELLELSAVIPDEG